MNPLILGYPDYSLPFVLHTDSSNSGLGAELYQRQSGIMRVIRYGSRTISPAKRNYHLHSVSQNSYYSCFCCFHFMFAFSCFVFACRNLVVSFSLSKFVRFIVNYL